MEREKTNGQPSSPTGRFRTRYTGNILLLCGLAVLVTAAFNLFLAQLPARWSRLDMTGIGLYSLSDYTKQVLSELDQEITIYQVAQYGSEDSIIQELLARYAGASGRVRVRQVDPVLEPETLAPYASSMEANSVIVAGEDRFRILSPSKLYVNTASDAQFAGEQEITGAIAFAVSGKSPRLYLLSGHGEGTLPPYIQEAIARENVETAALHLGTAGAVPEDADILLLYAPERDLLEEETRLLLDYLQAGGRMILIGGSLSQPAPNLDALAAGYGITREKGTVVEGDSNHFLEQYPSYVLAGIGGHSITQPLRDRGYFVLSPMSQGLAPADGVRSSISASALLYTTEASLSVSGTGEDGEPAEAYARGPFTVGLAVEEEVPGGTTRLVWFTSPYLLLEDVNELSSGANCDLFLNTLSWMYDFDQGISIRAKTLMMDYLVIRPGTGMALGVLLAAVLPAAVLAAGAVVLYRRRRR